jgi:hypothetical protein
LSTLFVMNKINSALSSVFQLSLQSTPCWVLSVVLLACHTCYRCYCPSQLTVLQLSLLPRTLNVESSSNTHSNTEWHQCKNVTWKWWWISHSSLHFLPQIIFQTMSLHIVLWLWITLCVCMCVRARVCKILLGCLQYNS